MATLLILLSYYPKSYTIDCFRNDAFYPISSNLRANNMPDLHELYQDLIIDHGRHPRHFGALLTANRQAEGFNPLCGDRLTLYLEIEANVIKDVTFKGVGCAISIASASLMAEQLIGKTEAAAQILFQAFHQQLTTEHSTNVDNNLGKLTALSGVRAFPTRVKCATLAWHTLQAALSKTTQAAQPAFVSTEGEDA